MKICTNQLPDVTFPAMGDLLEIVNSMYAIPAQYRGGFSLPFPALPTMPSPLSSAMSDFNMPSFEAQQAMAAMFSNLHLAIVNICIETIDAIVPVTSLIPSPIIPGLPFDFTDLLPPFDPSGLIEKLKPFVDVNFPFVPTLWPDLNNPSLKILNMLQFIQVEISKLMTMTLPAMIDLLVGYIEDVLLLPVPALPTIPKIPTAQEIIAMLPTTEIMDGLTMPTLDSLRKLVIPPFPGLALPDPLLPDMKISSLELTYGVQTFIPSMISYVLKLITDAITKLLDIVGVPLVLPTLKQLFPMPIICVEIPIL